MLIKTLASAPTCRLTSGPGGVRKTASALRSDITDRWLQGSVTIWLVTLGVFRVLRLTGDPVSYMLPPDASKEDRARLIALYGFNDPLWKQYLVFNNNLLHGRFGPSLRWDSRDALEVFLSRLPATLALTGAAM